MDSLEGGTGVVGVEVVANSAKRFEEFFSLDGVAFLLFPGCNNVWLKSFVINNLRIQTE